MRKRVFFAIELPHIIKERLEDFFEKARDIESVRWEFPEKLHITLAFLGTINEEDIEKLRVITREIAEKTPSFTLTLDAKLSAFPSLSTPKILWLPVTGDVEILQNLKSQLEKKLYEEHFLFDTKESIMHVTIGRVKQVSKEQISQIEKLLPKDFPSFTASGKTLFESVLGSLESSYTVLQYENFRN